MNKSLSSINILAATGVSFLVLSSIAEAQIIRFPGGASPVITTPTIQAVDSSGRPAMIMDARTSNKFAASYDVKGHLSSLKSTTGHNAFDLDAIQYTQDGHLQMVHFGNQYLIVFRYRRDGTREVVDSAGGHIVQGKAASGQFASSSVVDPSGFLVPSLQLLGGLFSTFSKVPGMSVAY